MTAPNLSDDIAWLKRRTVSGRATTWYVTTIIEVPIAMGERIVAALERVQKLEEASPDPSSERERCAQIAERLECPHIADVIRGGANG